MNALVADTILCSGTHLALKLPRLDESMYTSGGLKLLLHRKLLSY